MPEDKAAYSPKRRIGESSFDISKVKEEIRARMGAHAAGKFGKASDKFTTHSTYYDEHEGFDIAAMKKGIVDSAADGIAVAELKRGQQKVDDALSKKNKTRYIKHFSIDYGEGHKESIGIPVTKNDAIVLDRIIEMESAAAAPAYEFNKKDMEKVWSVVVLVGIIFFLILAPILGIIILVFFSKSLAKLVDAWKK